MKLFPKIKQYRSALKRAMSLYEEGCLPNTFHFQGTAKLHGTNAAIRRVKGLIRVYSRTQELSSTNDNHGFFQFVKGIPGDKLDSLFEGISGSDDVTLFGEWVGKGIQAAVAVSNLDKHFVIFRVQDNNTGLIKANSPTFNLHLYSIFNILRIPSYLMVVDVLNPQEGADHAASLTLQVENECPWAKSFGVSGVGEGIVWTSLDRHQDGDLTFKVKGEKHSNKKAKVPGIATSPEKLAGIEEFVDYVFAGGRLDQGIQHLIETGRDLSIESVGAYLKWVSQDILDEEYDVLAKSGLEWKEVAKAINTYAKTYFIKGLDMGMGIK